MTQKLSIAEYLIAIRKDPKTSNEGHRKTLGQFGHHDRMKLRHIRSQRERMISRQTESLYYQKLTDEEKYIIKKMFAKGISNKLIAYEIQKPIVQVRGYISNLILKGYSYGDNSEEII